MVDETETPTTEAQAAVPTSTPPPTNTARVPDTPAPATPTEITPATPADTPTPVVIIITATPMNTPTETPFPMFTPLVPPPVSTVTPQPDAAIRITALDDQISELADAGQSARGVSCRDDAHLLFCRVHGYDAAACCGGASFTATPF